MVAIEKIDSKLIESGNYHYPFPKRTHLGNNPNTSNNSNTYPDFCLKGITKVYRIKTLSSSPKGLHDLSFSGLFNELRGDCENHYIRIEDFTYGKEFYIYVFSKREMPFYECKKEERYLTLFPDINFYNCFYLPFLNGAYANIVSKQSYDDETQLLSYYFFFGAYTVDQIFFKDKSEMILKYYDTKKPRLDDDYDEEQDDSRSVTESLAMGLYINERKSLVTGNLFEKERFIWLSKELLDNCYRRMVFNKLFIKSEIRKRDFENTVFFHELGHATFNNPYYDISLFLSADITLCERRANYYASVLTLGRFDKEMLALSYRQPVIYRNPLLVSQRFTLPDYAERQKKVERH